MKVLKSLINLLIENSLKIVNCKSKISVFSHVPIMKTNYSQNEPK